MFIGVKEFSLPKKKKKQTFLSSVNGQNFLIVSWIARVITMYTTLTYSNAHFLYLSYK